MKILFNIITMSIFCAKTINQIEQIKIKHTGKKIGFACSCFDILHCGHAIMLKDCKSKCDTLVIALQTDPTLDRKDKNTPIQLMEERKIMVESIRYVDEVIEYATEEDLLNILHKLQPDVRIIGTDWKSKKYTGYEIDIPIHWHIRDHEWSTSGLRRRIAEAENKK
jgi:glycerol-3-phosphate cytidylyltransferase